MRTVFLHGFTGHSTCFDPIVARCRGDGHSYPLLGHDPEVPAGTTVTFDAEVDRIAARIRCDAAACEDESPICLVGYSMGARVALSLLIRHPSLCASAILIGGSPGLTSNAAREERIVADARFIDMLRRDGLHRFLDAWEAQPLFDTQRQLRGDTFQEQRKRRERHDPNGLAAAMDVLGLGRMPNLWSEIAGISVPVRLVVGAYDSKFHGIAEQMVETSKSNMKLEVVNGVGHNVVLEDPDALARLILAQ